MNINAAMALLRKRASTNGYAEWHELRAAAEVLPVDDGGSYVAEEDLYVELRRRGMRVEFAASHNRYLAPLGEGGLRLEHTPNSAAYDPNEPMGPSVERLLVILRGGSSVAGLAEHRNAILIARARGYVQGGGRELTLTARGREAIEARIRELHGTP